MARPLASLSSGLLARPGRAKPAMRPQGFAAQVSEDLGWNDMGTVVASPLPPVLVERAELTREVAAASRTVAAPATPRAAFTLRLDAERHMRLRLASAMARRSAQQVVIAALDAFLDAQPQVDQRVAQVGSTLSHRISGETQA